METLEYWKQRAEDAEMYKKATDHRADAWKERAEAVEAQLTKLRELIDTPSEAMIEAGAEATASHSETSKWPEDFDALEVRCARRDAAKIWRYMAAALRTALEEKAK